jgi:hypothetical protein
MESFDVDVISTKACRVNYGVVHEEPYDKNQHPKEQPYTDEDGHSYVLRKISWLVTKGELISSKDLPGGSINVAIRKRSMKQNNWPVIRLRIVQFHGPPEKLPDKYNAATVSTVTTMEYELGQKAASIDGLDLDKPRFRVKNVFRGRLYQAKFEIRVRMSPTSLEIDLRSKNVPLADKKVQISWTPGKRVVARARSNHRENMRSFGNWSDSTLSF